MFCEVLSDLVVKFLFQSMYKLLNMVCLVVDLSTSQLYRDCDIPYGGGLLILALF